MPACDDSGRLAVNLEIAVRDAFPEWTPAHARQQVAVMFCRMFVSPLLLEDRLHDTLLIDFPPDSAHWTIGDLLAEWSR